MTGEKARVSLKVYPFMSAPFARKSHLHHSIQLKSLYSCENIFATHELDFPSALHALKLWKIKHNREVFASAEKHFHLTFIQCAVEFLPHRYGKKRA